MIEKMLVKTENSEVNVEYNMNEVKVNYTASFGFYYFKVNDRISMERGYVQADHLLLDSKQSGRNRISMKNELSEIVTN
jgi:PleD family two-component response regulator